MKKTFLLLASVLMLSSCTTKIEHFSYNEGINIIPVPVELTQTEGSFTLTSNTVIVAPNIEVAANSAAYLVAKIKASTGYDLNITHTQPASNYILIDVVGNSELKPEGYTLESTVNGVTINGVDQRGAFYGVQTLLQLFPAQIESTKKIKNTEWTIPLVAVKDYPRFQYRGVMIDPCRHFVDVEFLKKQLDVLAMFKINTFHWHLTEDQGWRIEIKKYPKLTEVGSVRTEGDGSTYGPFFYTQEQIKEVVAYAAERHIEVIPEIELPGHALAAMAGYPEYSCTGGPFSPRIIWGVEEDVYCAGNDATFAFLEDIISEVMELFPSEYFHIGGDECPKGAWEKCEKCQARIKQLGYKGYTDQFGHKHSKEYQLQSYFITRIGEFIDSKGKKMIGWDEILEGGLAPSATVMSWRGESGGIQAVKMGHNCIMTPGDKGMYVDHYQGAMEVEPTAIGGYAPLSKGYDYDPIPASLTEEEGKRILGAQVNMWSEYLVNEGLFEYMIYPRALAMAEITWSQLSRKNFEDFSRRILNAYARMDYHGINYHIPMPEGVLTQNVVFTGDSTSLVFTNTRNMPMVYTLDGTTPNSNSALFQDSIVVGKEGANIAIATLLPTGKTSTVRTIPVTHTELIDAEITPENGNRAVPMKSGFVAARTAEGLFLNETEFQNAQFNDTEFPNLNEVKARDIFRYRGFNMKKPSLTIFEGYFEAPEDGVYTFSTDMAELWIGGKRIIENHNGLSRHSSKKTQVGLKAGKHPYKMVHNNMIVDGWPSSWSEISFQLKTPSSDRFELVKPSMLFN